MKPLKADERYIVQIAFQDERLQNPGFVEYTRTGRSSAWALRVQQRAAGSFIDILEQDHGLPTQVHSEPLEHMPLRTGKVLASFRKNILQDMHSNQRILNSFVLFNCQLCNERFAAFHPQHTPAFQLECLAACPCEVAQWDDEPSERQNSPNSTQAFVSAVFLTLLKFKEINFCLASAFGQQETA